MHAVLMAGILSICLPAMASTKAQVQAVLGATALSNITSISEDADLSRCFGCRVLTVKGEGAFGEAWQQILVQQDGPDTFSTQILSQSR